MGSEAAQLFSLVSPEMFDWVQVQTLAGPLKNFQRLVPKPLLYCFGCVLRVIVLLEGEPLSQSEVLSALEQVFNKAKYLLERVLRVGAAMVTSAAWLGCVSEDALLSTFISPEPVRELYSDETR
jgi:hypothetical protein